MHAEPSSGFTYLRVWPLVTVVSDGLAATYPSTRLYSSELSRNEDKCPALGIDHGINGRTLKQVNSTVL